jgi:hypothetical protein
MGLSIEAYSKLERAPFDDVRAVLEDQDPYEIADEHAWVYFYVHPAFPQRAGGIGCVTKFAFYLCGGEVYRFRAGSYGGYGDWRAALASFVGVDDLGSFRASPDLSIPFGHLLHFSDCEGTIGPEVSAKLAADFEKYFPAYVLNHADDAVTIYDNFRRAFQLAADGGAVAFH